MAGERLLTAVPGIAQVAVGGYIYQYSYINEHTGLPRIAQVAVGGLASCIEKVERHFSYTRVEAKIYIQRVIEC